MKHSFFGGVHPAGHKESTRRKPIARLDRPPEQVITPENLQAVYGIEIDVVTVRDRYGAPRTICLPVKRPCTPGREGTP